METSSHDPRRLYQAIALLNKLSISDGATRNIAVLLSQNDQTALVPACALLFKYHRGITYSDDTVRATAALIVFAAIQARSAIVTNFFNSGLSAAAVTCM